MKNHLLIIISLYISLCLQCCTQNADKKDSTKVEQSDNVIMHVSENGSIVVYKDGYLYRLSADDKGLIGVKFKLEEFKDITNKLNKDIDKKDTLRSK